MIIFHDDTLTDTTGREYPGWIVHRDDIPVAHISQDQVTGRWGIVSNGEQLGSSSDPEGAKDLAERLLGGSEENEMAKRSEMQVTSETLGPEIEESVFGDDGATVEALPAEPAAPRRPRKPRSDRNQARTRKPAKPNGAANGIEARVLAFRAERVALRAERDRVNSELDAAYDALSDEERRISDALDKVLAGAE